MAKTLSIHDIIHHYFFYRCSSSFPCSPGRDLGTMMNEMNEIKDEYQKSLTGLSVWTLMAILRMAVRGINIGHQTRVPILAIDDAVLALSTSSFFSSTGSSVPFIKRGRFYDGFEDFEELYNVVNDIIGTITGIGPVTVYDTARRIGHCLPTPIYPKKYVYLPADNVHAAAEYLLQKKLDKIVLIDEFFHVFGTLPPIFIEDILCIYSNYFYGDVDRKRCALSCNYIKDDTFGKPWWLIKIKDFVDNEDLIVLNGKIKGPKKWPEFIK